MVTKKIRSEYMKKFKDPKWETYSKCYEDLLKYRLTRRLLEYTHNPWFWGGCESDSDSSGRSTPPNRSKVAPVVAKEETVPEETLEAQEQGKAAAALEPSPPEDAQDAAIGEPSQEALGKAVPDGHAPTMPKLSRKPTRTKSKPAAATATGEERHPFALYGWAEQQADMAGKKTHNVRPVASTREIHASALRAKSRREVEKRMKTLDRRRVRSADLDKLHKVKPVPEYNPWMTEYMRCFSARSR
ncbi:hypothetical protein MATL_G00190200 [Megalops atlanticus]|uniref:Centriole, cilia and spindle-associated protein n=1 Tax=Megalops atlanticus TaxID=7932 RepID=A0A9D3T1R3_MEGAT|nr:hypothetical protein MATL_G00190200 [Megalops atlanticus]